MRKEEKPYFNSLQELYPRRAPPVYDPQEIEGLQQVEEQVEAIQHELFANLADPAKARICFRKWGLLKFKGWRQIELKIYGVDYPERLRLFPETVAVLQRIPGLSTAYFSVLAPHADIPPHNGDTDAFYRVHVGLKVPAGLPACGLEVAGQPLAWREGVSFAFNDIYHHKAWNHTDQERIVLILDILRPEFREQKLWVDAGVRATLYWSRVHRIFLPLVELLPRVVTRLIPPVFHWLNYAWQCWIRERPKP